MYTTQFTRITNGYTDRQRQAAEMLIAGVAFQQDGKTWTVYSHEGEFIGTLSTFIACETANMLKKAGLKSNASSLFKGGGNAHPTKPGFGVLTFGFNNNIPNEEMRVMMDRRFKKPLTLL